MINYLLNYNTKDYKVSTKLIYIKLKKNFNNIIYIYTQRYL